MKTMLRSLLRFLRPAAFTLATLTVLIHVTPLVEWWARGLSRDWHQPEGDIMIVLGGAGLEDGTVGINSYWRTVYASRLWKQVRFRRVILCGGPAASPISNSMRTLLIGLGVPSEVIETETFSKSTRENATASRRILQGDTGRILLVTSDYHMYRAHGVFRREGLAVMPHPVPDALKRNNSWHERGTISYELLIESVKILYYRYQGWMA